MRVDLVGGDGGGGGVYNLQHPRSCVRTTRSVSLSARGCRGRFREVLKESDRCVGSGRDRDLCVGSGGRTPKSTGDEE